MTRKLKFANADDLIANCRIEDDCFVWAPKRGYLIDNPCLAPLSPISIALQTNSVARVLFTACRHIPASGRLVKWCTTKSCVNPYHHSESRPVLQQRVQIGEVNGTGFFTELLPEQEAIRHLLPSQDILSRVRPTQPATLALLLKSAMLSGFDAQKLATHKLQTKVTPTTRPADKPVLVLSSRLMPRRVERTEEEEAALKKESHDFLNQDIFAQIAARKKAKLRKLVDDWDTDVK